MVVMTVSYREEIERYEKIRENPLEELRTLYISERLWRKIRKDVRKRLLKYFKKDFYVNRHVANIVSDVRLFTQTYEEEKQVLNALEEALLDIFE